MNGLNRVLRFFTTLLFTDGGEYSWVVEIVTVEAAAVSGVVTFGSLELEAFSPKLVLAVVVPAAVLCTGSGTWYPVECLICVGSVCFD